MKNKQDEGSFLTGLGLGMLAGAVGYFFLGTKEGHESFQKAKKEWEKAKEQLFSQFKDGETNQQAETSWRDCLKQCWTEWCDSPLNNPNNPKAKKTQPKTTVKAAPKNPLPLAKPKRAWTKRKQSKFKGV